MDAGDVLPKAFVNRPKGSKSMSVSWSKYSTPDEARNRGRKPPEEYAVVQSVAGDVRRVPGQTVEHSPDELRRDRSHADVTGEKTSEVRTLLSRAFETVAIPLQPNPQGG